MSDQSSIEWTDATWNPVTGCTKVSPGCDHCYAETLFNRFNGPGAFDTVTLRPERFDQPLRWRKPRRIFVNSMSDLFHQDVPDEFIANVFAIMGTCAAHTFQVLTKRHGRMRSLLNNPEFVENVIDHQAEWMTIGPSREQQWPGTWPLPNVWLGVSVETQQWADIRIPALLDTPAEIRFLSCEPLLGPVELDRWLWRYAPVEPDWVIAGGESGHGARPMHPYWARALRDQCAAFGVPFLFKQWGEWSPSGYGARVDISPDQELSLTREHWFPTPAPDDARLTHTLMKRVGKGKAGRLLDGRTHDEFPITEGAHP